MLAIVAGKYLDGWMDVMDRYHDTGHYRKYCVDVVKCCLGTL